MRGRRGDACFQPSWHPAPHSRPSVPRGGSHRISPSSEGPGEQGAPGAARGRILTPPPNFASCRALLLPAQPSALLSQFWVRFGGKTALIRSVSPRVYQLQLL